MHLSTVQLIVALTSKRLDDKTSAGIEDRVLLGMVVATGSIFSHLPQGEALRLLCLSGDLLKTVTAPPKQST